MNRLVAIALVAVACHGTPRRDGPPPAKVLQLNHPGQLIDLAAAIEPGVVTVVDFWAPWCGGCAVAEDALMATIGDEPRVVVRKVDVGDGRSPVARHYDVGPLPHLRVFDATGTLRYVLIGNDAMTAGDRALELLHE